MIICLDMDKLMPLDILSSIKGAKSSDAVNKLFDVIKDAHSSSENDIIDMRDSDISSLDDLRDDSIIDSTSNERKIIKENFPKEKNGYLVVKKVIEE